MNIVEYAVTKRSVVESFAPDTYAFRRDRGWVALQTFALWILRKLKCFAPVKDVCYTRCRIDSFDLLKALLAQQRDLLEFYHLRGERVLVGYDVYSELAQLTQPVSLTLQYHLSDAGKTTICGMKVTVIPWMRGMLVLPKDV
jgi:hypothetical protein